MRLSTVRRTVRLLILPLLLSNAIFIPLSRAVVFHTNSIGNFLPDVGALNRTMGHSSALWALGLGVLQEGGSSSTDKLIIAGDAGADDDEGEEDELGELITSEYMRTALARAQHMTVTSPEDISREGWKLIFSSPLVSLLKRRVDTPDRKVGPVEYLMYVFMNLCWASLMKLLP
jgi:hypothetical protein